MKSRTATLNGALLALPGRAPRAGSTLEADFSIPAARKADRPLERSALTRGLVFVSTLPNIQKHACTVQVVDLEEHCDADYPDARIAHVSADAEEHWREVDEYHPNVKAAGYSLSRATSHSREAFSRAFGVKVEGSRRIAHGLFALWDGVFLATSIPKDQMRAADVHAVLRKVKEKLGR